jgi:hypothetical protein
MDEDIGGVAEESSFQFYFVDSRLSSVVLGVSVEVSFQFYFVDSAVVVTVTSSADMPVTFNSIL